MKMTCLQCDKTYYTSEKNYNGYPFYQEGFWREYTKEDGTLSQKYIANKNVEPQNRLFHSRLCMDQFLEENQIMLTPIFKEVQRHKIEMIEKELGITHK